LNPWDSQNRRNAAHLLRVRIRGIFWIITSLAGLIALSVLWVIYNPGWVLNPTALSHAAEFARKHEWIDARWDDLKVSANSLSFFEKEATFRFQNLCVRDFRGTFDFCAGAAEIRTHGGWIQGKFQLSEVGPIRLDSVHGNLDFRHETSPTETQENDLAAYAYFLSEIADFIKDAKIGDFHADVAAITVFLKAQTIAGSARIAMDHKSGLSKLHLEALAETPNQTQSSGRMDLVVNVQGPEHFFSKSSSQWSLISDLKVKEWSLNQKRRLNGALRIQGQGQGLFVTGQTRFAAKVSEGSKKLPSQVEGVLSFIPTEKGYSYHRASGRISIRDFWLNSKKRAQGSFDLDAQQEGSGLQLQTVVKGKVLERSKSPNLVNVSLHTKVDDLATLHRGLIVLSGRVSEPPVAVENCEIQLAQMENKKETGSLSLHCPARVTLGELRKKIPGIDLPSQLKFLVQSQIQIQQYPPTPSSLLDGALKVEMDPVQSASVEARTLVDARIRGVPGRFPEGWIVDEKVAIQLKIASFQDWVKHFSATPWAIPAPFSVLKGQVEFSAIGNSEKGKLILPLKLVSRLSSHQQFLDLDGTGSLVAEPLAMKPYADLNFDLLLSKVQLELIRLNIGEPPRLMPDHRLKKDEAVKSGEKSKEEKNPAFQFHYLVRARTPEHAPIRILSNLAKAPVPIGVDLKVSDAEPLDGVIQVKSVPLDLFRRTATLDHLRLDLNSPSSESKIDGVIKVAYVDYTVSILVISTLGKPVVKLISDPPLPENALLATLLFGRPIEDLDSDETESVGNTQAALADNAIGLASLYALASTPIQSVGYNPSTKIFNAKVRLAEGTSLNLGGTQTGIDEIGVRKRLSSKWSIRTDLQRSRGLEEVDRTNNVVTTFLEWVHRY